LEVFWEHGNRPASYQSLTRPQISTTVGVLSFAPGEAASSPLDTRIAFYEKVGSLITGTEVRVAGAPTSIPLPTTSIKDDDWVYTVTKRHLQLLGGVSDFLVIDLANPPRDDLPHFNILRSMADALSEAWWKLGGGLVSILLPKSLSPKDSVLGVLYSRLNAKELVLIDSEGRTYGFLPGGQVRLSRYAEELRVARKDPVALIQQRMIRRIGYFKRDSADIRATKYFFDCGSCIKDILDALDGEIDFSSSEQLLVHAPVSRWMQELAESISIKYNVQALDLGLLVEGEKQGPQPEIKSSPIVLLPLVDTGETIHGLSEFIKRCNPYAQPRYVSVLSTGRTRVPAGLGRQGSPAGRLKAVTTVYGDTGHDVHYLLTVQQSYYSDANLPLALSEHEGSSRSLLDESARLTSFAFWSMVDEAGWRDELNVPKPRGFSMGNVPNFPKVLQLNGPLLAHKFRRVMEESPGGIPTDPIFICPMEDGASQIVSYLFAMYGFSFVRIPRDEFEVDLTGSNVADVLGTHDWWQQLVTAAGAGARAILVDEFRVRGGSLKNLGVICELVGLPVERSLVLADFAAANFPVAGAPVDHLYRIPLFGEA
jgi:hypothetical protein